MKIQFNAEKHRTDIESGKLKVITRKGLEVNIFDWNLGMGDFPIVAQIRDRQGNYGWSDYTNDGISRDDQDLDLFILGDEEEEKSLMDSSGWVILLVLMIMGFTFGCLEYRFGDKRTGESILWFLLICSIPLAMIAKALTNGRKS